MTREPTHPRSLRRTRSSGSRRARSIVPAIVALAAAALGAIPSGCNIVAPAYFILHGPEKVPALFELEPDRPTVIFVDDRANRLPRRAMRQTIGEAAQDVLLKQKALTNAIDTRGAIAASSQDRAGQTLSIVDIGKAVGAEIVVYATVDAFTLSTDGQSYSPAATLRVKVIDVVADSRVWPEEKEGHPLTLNFPTRTQDVPRTAAEIRKFEDETARLVGTSLAQIFYKYERAQDAGRQ